jgi:hypothetical protein
MSKERTQGKGDTQRPCNKDKFDSEFDRIFGKKETQIEIDYTEEHAKRMIAKWWGVANKIGKVHDEKCNFWLAADLPCTCINE